MVIISKEEVERRVFQIISDCMQTPSSHVFHRGFLVESIGMDHIDEMEIVMDIEDELEIIIPVDINGSVLYKYDEFWAGLKNLGELVDKVYDIVCNRHRVPRQIKQGR